MEARAPVESPPRIGDRSVAADGRDQPVAVEFDLVDPARAFRRLVHQRRQLRRNELRRRAGALCRWLGARFGFWRPRADLADGGSRCAAVCTIAARGCPVGLLEAPTAARPLDIAGGDR